MQLFTVGQIERATQNRVVKLFQSALGYDYLGDWGSRVGNRNIDDALARRFLKKQGYDDALANRALHQINKVAATRPKACMTRIKPSMSCCATG